MLALAALSGSAALFLATSLGIGLGSVAAQVLVPFAAHLAREETRGQTVGKVVSGLLVGIMLARPLASLVADHFGWHAVYGGAALAVALLAYVLRARLQQRIPQASLPYGRLTGSMWQLLRTTPLLRRRAVYHAAMFASFSLFWTVTPLVLAGPGFRLSQTGIAVFALVGVAGAVASPIAGRLADRGHTLYATAAALLLGVAGFALPLAAPDSREPALALLVLASIVLDMGVAANLVLSQRAVGSALGGWMLAHHGWHAALLTGMAFPAAALAWWSGEWAARRVTRSVQAPLR